MTFAATTTIIDQGVIVMRAFATALAAAAALPAAEQAGVKLAMHPDDPPLSPIRGLGRIMRSVDNYQRLLDIYPSPVNGIGLCQGNFTLMTDDLPAVIRHFGRQKKIFFVHFRDVRGTPDNFVFPMEVVTPDPCVVTAFQSSSWKRTTFTLGEVLLYWLL